MTYCIKCGKEYYSHTGDIKNICSDCESHATDCAELKNDFVKVPLTETDLLNLGFRKLPHFTVQKDMVYDLYRNVSLSMVNVGTPNEMLFICEENSHNARDVVVLHNYDFDGYMSLERLEVLIRVLKKTEKKMEAK